MSMSLSHPSAAGAAQEFPSTHWSLIGRAGDPDRAVRRRAVARLLERYWQPLRAHLTRRRGIDVNEADDLLQAFVVSRVLEDDLIARASRERGRFRAFLVTSLDRFVSNERRHARARKRAALAAPASLDDGPPVADPAGGPDEAFDLAWARQVIRETLRHMYDQCRRQDRPDVWGVFDARVLAVTLGGREPVPYEQLVDEFKLASAEQAWNVLATGKRMFARALRSVVEEYEADPAEVDAEIVELKAALSRPGLITTGTKGT